MSSLLLLKCIVEENAGGLREEGWVLALAWRAASVPGERRERETASAWAREGISAMRGNLSSRGFSGMHGGAGRRMAGRVSVQSREEQGACIYQGMDPQPGPQEPEGSFPRRS